MKKLSLALAISAFTVCAAHAISITEYIEKFGPVKERNGVINLVDKDLTSLNGIELITKEPETIKAIDLSNNKLISISASQIEIFPNLERLNLSDNQLTSFPSLKLPKLKKLKIKQNNIEILSDLDLPELRKLKAGDNPIHTLSDLNFPKLKKLKLKGNKLSKIYKVNVPSGTKIKVGGPAKALFVEIDVAAENVK